MEVNVSIATLLPERAGRAPSSPSFVSPLDTVLADIVHKIFVRPDGSGSQAVAVIYTRQDQGATLLCASLANLLGDLHGKVLAISARELFVAAAGRQGAGDVHFTKIGASSVWVAPAASDGTAPESQMPNLDIAITSLRDQFDFLVIDGGAFSDLRRAEGMAQHIDGFLVIVNEGATAMRDLVVVRERIQKSGGRILGSIYSATAGSVMAGVR
jgi:Mrp family chromosome partitioning ATPase